MCNFTTGAVLAIGSKLDAKFLTPASPPKVIGLMGKAGSGKDLVGALLRMQGYKRLAFADAVRDEVTRAVVSGVIPFGFEPWSELLDGATAEEVWEKPTTERMRKVLQLWGTEFRREQCSNYWVEKVRRQVGKGRWVVTDVRFPNEVEMKRHQNTTTNRPHQRPKRVMCVAALDLIIFVKFFRRTYL